MVPRRPSGPNVSGTLLRVEDWDEPRAAADLVTCPECGHRFATKAASDAGRVILIVEDTEFFLHLATEVLSKRYRTVTARSVGEARHILATTPVDLVLLDLTLPDAEGTELLRSLPRTDIPVLIYTSRDETALLGTEWEILQALGARDVIHKGINIEDLLLRKVQELLERAPAAPLA